MNRSVLPTTDELELKKHALRVESRKVVSQPSNQAGFIEMTPWQLSSVLFDQACIRAGAKSSWVAATLGVSDPTVSKWRSPEYREGPSWAQIIALGEEFQLALKKEQEKYHGWHRKALLDLCESLGALAHAVGE